LLNILAKGKERLSMDRAKHDEGCLAERARDSGELFQSLPDFRIIGIFVPFILSAPSMGKEPPIEREQ